MYNQIFSFWLDKYCVGEHQCRIHVRPCGGASEAGERLSSGLRFPVEAEVGQLRLFACCLFVFWTNGTSWVTIEPGFCNCGDLATVPPSHRIAMVAVCRACVYYLTDGFCLLLLSVHIVLPLCVCVCLWIVGGGSSIHERDILLSRRFPLCFHSDLVGDWWLNCGVHVNSNQWFMKILRVSEAAQAWGEEKDIAF